jgi:hypothetical protein
MFRLLFNITLAFNGLFALLLGVMNLVAFKASMEAFGLPYDERLVPMGIVVGSQFLLQASLLFAAIRWTRQNNEAGGWIGLSIGAYLVFLTILSVAMTGSVVALIFDGPRGLIMMVLGWLAGAHRPGGARVAVSRA